MTPEAEQYRDQLRAMLPELTERFHVAELGLFGSRVRGDHRPDSDLDVLVEYQTDARPTLIDVVELEYLLTDRLGVKVDLALKRSLKSYLRPYIIREAHTGMTRRSEIQRITDMIDAAGRTVRHLGQLNLEGLKTDELRSDAIVRALEVLGEACKHVSQPVRDRFPSVQWKLIAGMRDRLIHGYDQVDWAIVWETITRFIPAVLPELQRVRDVLLDEEPPAAPETDCG